MILQKDTYFNDYVKRFGCYFMSLIYLACQKASQSFDKDDIAFFYGYFVDKKWMDENCFIRAPEDILGFLGLKVKYLGHREGHDPTLGDELEILCFKRTYTDREGRNRTYKHFVVGDGLGHVAYDPIGMSNAVKYGELVSKRVFKLS
jgi:hypothetical protein